MSTSRPCQLLEMLERHAAEQPTAIAVCEVGPDGTEVVCYRDLRKKVRAFATRLHGILPAGSVVMLCSPNVPAFHVAFLGALAAGCTVFPMSPEAVRPELIAAAGASGASAVIGTAGVVAALQGHVPIAWPIDDLFADTTGSGSTTADPPSTSADLLLQTSGTTGRPGIVRRSAASVDAVAQNMVEAIGFRPADRVFSTVPLCHSYGLEHGVLAPILAGSTVCLCRTFNLATVIDILQRESITIFPAVPSIFEMIGRLAHNDAAFPRLRRAYSAGSLLPIAVAEMMRRRFGIKVGQIYGATEVGSVTFNDPDARDYDPSSAGLPMNGVQIRALAINGGAEGHIHVSAPSMFSGYLQGDGSEIQDGFFATGDVGFISSDRMLTITGRLKLLIDVGGFKVNPTEVELLLAEHPGVAECVVVPVPVTETVNRLKALIVPRRNDHPPAAEDLARFARERLTAYKVPRVFEIRQTLPRTPTGKVLRHLIES